MSPRLTRLVLLPGYQLQIRALQLTHIEQDLLFGIHRSLKPVSTAFGKAAGSYVMGNILPSGPARMTSRGGPPARGVLTLEILGYSQHRGLGAGKFIQSAPLDVGGYRYGGASAATPTETPGRNPKVSSASTSSS